MEKYVKNLLNFKLKNFTNYIYVFFIYLLTLCAIESLLAEHGLPFYL